MEMHNKKLNVQNGGVRWNESTIYTGKILDITALCEDTQQTKCDDSGIICNAAFGGGLIWQHKHTSSSGLSPSLFCA